MSVVLGTFILSVLIGVALGITGWYTSRKGRQRL